MGFGDVFSKEDLRKKHMFFLAKLLPPPHAFWATISILHNAKSSFLHCLELIKNCDYE